MSETEEQLNNIEISIDDARKTMQKMHTLQRLLDSKDWQEIVEDGYFHDEASRLVILKADPSMLSKEKQKEINTAINAIGPFRQYLRVIMQFGMMAERAMEADEQTREELLIEEANEEVV